MKYYFLHSEELDTKNIIFHILGSLPDHPVDSKKFPEYRNIIEKLLPGTGVEIDFNQWEKFSFWQYGSPDRGFLSLSLESCIAGGGPAMNDTFEAEHYYITCNDNPLIVSTYGYTRQGCFLVTNNVEIFSQAKKFLSERFVNIRECEWDPEKSKKIPWHYIGYQRN